jgi:hypothetical protein
MVDEDSGGPVGRKELLTNIRRLTIAILDNLEEGSRDKTLDQGQKRLLSSTASRLLRLWRSTLNDDEIRQTSEARRAELASSERQNGHAVS